MRRIKEKRTNYASKTNTSKTLAVTKMHMDKKKNKKTKWFFLTLSNTKNKHNMDAVIEYVSGGIIYLIYHFDEGIHTMV